MSIVAWGYGQPRNILVSWGYGLFPAGAINSPAYDLVILLERVGLGTTGIDLFVGMMPDLPDFCIAAYDTGGRPPSARFLRDEPTVQIRVRGNTKDLLSAAAKMQEIRDALLNSGDQTVDSSTYIQYHEFLGVINWPRDDKDRPMLSTNFRLIRLVAPSIKTSREVL